MKFEKNFFPWCLGGLVVIFLSGCASPSAPPPATAHTVNTHLGGVVYPLAKAQGVIERLQDNAATLHQRGAEAGSRLTQAVMDDAGRAGALMIEAERKADEAQGRVEADALTLKELSGNNVKLAAENGELRKTIGAKIEIIAHKNWLLAWAGIALTVLVLGIAGYIAWKVFVK